MNLEAVAHRTRSYIRKNFLYTRPDFELADDAQLLEAGIIDSMGIMELIEFVEDSFGIQIDDEEITEENLGTVAAISGYVSGKLNVTAA